MGYYNPCSEHPHVVHQHEGDHRIFNFEQFDCRETYKYKNVPSARIVAHSIIKVYTRGWRDLFRRRVWIRCFRCKGRWELFQL